MNDKQRILFVVTKGDWGGAQKYVYDLSTSFKQSANVSVATGIPTTGQRLVNRLGQENIPVHILTHAGRDVSIKNDLRTVIDLMALMRRIHPDVVHINSSKMGLAALVAKVCGVRRIIFTVHGWPFFENRGYLAKKSMWFFSWLTALFSHAIIVISKNDHEKAVRMPFISRKTHLIYNGIDAPARIDNPREALATLLGIPLKPSTRIIGTIAEFTPNKGLSFLIDAFAHLQKDGQADLLILIGGGELHHALERQIRACGLVGKVLLHPFLPDATHYLRAFDICALPSVKEGLPYVLLEAGMSGVSIVASDVGGIRELLSHSGTTYGILVPSRDPDALKKALTHALCNAPPTNPQLFIHRFSKHVMVDATRKLYI
ncbi:MAG: glycosyltransferase [bacterium]|nr:glycosyltransferase [bacterium]